MDILVFAGFWRRVFAYFIDIILISAILWITALLINNYYYELNSNYQGIGYLIVFIYFVLFNSKLSNGQTLGKLVLEIETRNINGEYISLLHSFIRMLLAILILYSAIFIIIILSNIIYSLNSFWFFIFLALSAFTSIMFLYNLGLIALSKNKRALYDFLSDTVVIKKSEKVHLQETTILKYNEDYAEKKKKYFYFIVAILILHVPYIYILGSNSPFFLESYKKWQIIQNELSNTNNNYQVTIQEIKNKNYPDGKIQLIQISFKVDEDIIDNESLSKNNSEAVLNDVLDNVKSINDYHVLGIILINGFDFGIIHSNKTRKYAYDIQNKKWIMGKKQNQNQ